MSKTNHKPTPLSSEELLELLNTKTSDGILLSDLDDFEKDALEGFMGESNPEAVKKMIGEVESSIEQRLTVHQAPSKKNRIAWFSIAACIVLIIGLSVFFLQETTQKEEIALNDSNAKSQEEARPNNSSPDIEATKQDHLVTKDAITETANVPNPQERKANFFKLEEESDRNTSPSKNGDELLKNREKQKYTNQVDYEASLQQKNAPAKAIMADDVSLATNAKGESYKQGVVEGYDVVKDGDVLTTFEKATGKQIVNTSPVAATKGATTNNMASVAKEVVEAKKKTESKAKDDVNDNDQVSDAISSTRVMSRVDATTETVITEPNYSENYSNSYYKGGNGELKKYVQNYLQKTNSIGSLKGTYQIKGQVSKDGKFKVLSIVNSTKDCLNCERKLESILNATTEWKPALKNGQNSDSEANFELIF